MTDRDDRQRRLAWCFADFRRFCGLLQVVPQGGGERIPMLLTPIQRAYCERRTARDIILKPRKVYMTSLELARDLWWLVTRPGARVAVVMQSQTGNHVLKDVAGMLRVMLDSLRRVGVELPFERESMVHLSLPDRDATLSLITAGASEASAGKKGRGGVVNRLHISEAAFFEHGAETLNALSESVPREGSEVVIESTPNGAAGFYFESWRAAVEGRSTYRPHFFPWWMHPDYRFALEPGEEVAPSTPHERMCATGGATPENLKWFRWKQREKNVSEALIAQEFPSDPDTCFLVSGRTFFDAGKLTRDVALSRQPAHVDYNGALRMWELPKKGSRYVIGADASEGLSDERASKSAALVYERGTGAHVATLHGSFIPWELAHRLRDMAQFYNGALVAPERNNHGHAVIDGLTRGENAYQNVYVHQDGKAGWLTNEASRALMLDAMDSAHRKDSWRTPDSQVLGQMRTFVVNERGKPEHAKGAHDDLVMAAAIGWAVCTRPQPRITFELPDAFEAA